MARAKKGTEGFRGKIGNTVIYDLKGQLVKRLIGVNLNEPTDKQMVGRQRTSLVTALLRPVKEFIRIGFDVETRNTLLSPYNKATSVNRFNAVKGVYPDQQIDFSKVEFSRGNMMVDPEIGVRIIETGLEFYWNKDFAARGIKWNDGVMVMAYIPEKRDAYFQINGARRNEGVEKLVLPRFNETVRIETYVNFISADHQSISNCTYTGQVMW
ncbi:DUF6266 family protein [Pedobacter hartonius]|uniref:Uncharacterized protein n=1 Tax=Pedobacter hartonius TaxID=425514 RepID=A0A1H4BV35_9SPHI|nr:DUF6266 family protein [Pedobacter hartonius]SEA51950.1 hypothetical protein SAMN05443550_103478 [Pedobacter hartonius]